MGLTGSLAVNGQEALRESLASGRAAEARKAAIENKDYDLKMGRLTMSASASLRVDYNDNIEASDIYKQSDFILWPQVTTSGSLPVSDKNALNFSIGIGYQKYIEHSEHDRFIVAPGTELAFDLFVKDFRFTFYDRMSYSADPVSDSSATGSADYGGLDNVIGINALWDLNKVVLNAGFAHENWMSEDDSYQYMDRASELFSLRAGYAVSRTLAVGPEATFGITTYDLPILHDNTSYSVGAFAEWQLSPRIRTRAHAGYVGYTFDIPFAYLVGIDESLNTYYFNVGADHVVNKYLTASLDISRNIQFSTKSDYMELLTAQLGLNWRGIRDFRLSMYGVYEDGSQPPLLRLYSNRLIYQPQETWDRFGFGATLSRPIMKKLSASLSYRYYLRDSDVDYRTYHQNLVSLAFAYKF